MQMAQSVGSHSPQRVTGLGTGGAGPSVTEFFFDDRRDAIYVSSYGRGLCKIDRINQRAPIEPDIDEFDNDDEAADATDLDQDAPIQEHIHLDCRPCLGLALAALER